MRISRSRSFRSTQKPLSWELFTHRLTFFSSSFVTNSTCVEALELIGNNYSNKKSWRHYFLHANRKKKVWTNGTHYSILRIVWRHLIKLTTNAVIKKDIMTTFVCKKKTKNISNVLNTLNCRQLLLATNDISKRFAILSLIRSVLCIYKFAVALLCKNVDRSSTSWFIYLRFLTKDVECVSAMECELTRRR